MDATLLQQFRQQLASWTESRLARQRLPFQRLELCPKTLTERGKFKPDIILWINRDSQLAGSMILLPVAVDDEVLKQGVSLAKALGLGHFTTWAAREVSIWKLVANDVERLQSFALPPANQITPDDFQRVLDQLLEQLKVTMITCAPAVNQFPVHYFANLCLRNLQELTPNIIDSARLTAGQTAADDWVESAPREKAWLSLWRILFLLCKEKLPPGLQPEKLELALKYALIELTVGALKWLKITEDEAPLPVEAAVRLHHLVSRLKQVGWPADDRHARELVDLLLDEAGASFNYQGPALPWSSERVALRVGCLPRQGQHVAALVAPRACLAGWALKNALDDAHQDHHYAEHLSQLDSEHSLASGLALLLDRRVPSRQQSNERLMLLRQVWPSRRFDLPRATPAWLWDALYLTGRISDDLTLVLPALWQQAAGVTVLWDTLSERFKLTELCQLDTDRQALRFIEKSRPVDTIQIHRHDCVMNAPSTLFNQRRIFNPRLWFAASQEVLALLTESRLIDIACHDQEWSEPFRRGVFLYLKTRLGRHLWELCGNGLSLPEPDKPVGPFLQSGLPVPEDFILIELGSSKLLTDEIQLNSEQLEQEFTSIFGAIPELPDGQTSAGHHKKKSRRRGRPPTAESIEKLFLDGIPRFPEHYLMKHYRPALKTYVLDGPLELVGEFFDQISLRSISSGQDVEVAGNLLARALILASHSGRDRVSLPEDERILEDIVTLYCNELARLWDKLMGECRRFEPQRQLAINQARKVWRERGLPPENVYRYSSQGRD